MQAKVHPPKRHTLTNPDAKSAVEKMTFREGANGRNAIVFELVGKEKAEREMGQLDKLQVVTLAKVPISSCGDEAWLTANCQSSRK
jgi:hypothetical protein